MTTCLLRITFAVLHVCKRTSSARLLTSYVKIRLASTVSGGRPLSVMVIIMEGGLVSVSCKDKLDGISTVGRIVKGFLSTTWECNQKRKI